VTTATLEPEILQAGAGDLVVGISGSATRRAEYIDSSGKHAIAGEPAKFHDDTEECWLEAGGTITVGDRLKSDANGKGVTTTTDKDKYGAIALQSGASGDYIRVKVRIGDISV
jgi:hypothetical protein